MTTTNRFGQPTRPSPPLFLIVRFSASLPDIHLDILSPSDTTVAALKHQIRNRLQEPSSRHRLRFIHQGKILPDTSALSSVLTPLAPPQPPPPPPPRHDPKGKGKGIEGQPDPPARIYVNCSIGDLLTDKELAEEAEAASRPPDDGPERDGGAPTSQHRGPTLRDRRRGFDRLLDSGMTAAEVNQLRLQFVSLQEARYPPDAMPSPDALRSIEDAWLDDNRGRDGGGGAEVGDVFDDTFGMGAVVDTMVNGAMIGFFWPLGSLCWLTRAEGMWSTGQQFAIYFGCVLSITIGLLKIIGTNSD